MNVGGFGAACLARIAQALEKLPATTSESKLVAKMGQLI